MAPIVSISISADDIRVVVATHRRGSVRVERVFRLSDEELDAFLCLDPAESYLVSVDWEELYQEIVLIPPAGEAYVEQLVVGEVRRLRPEVAGHAYFFETLGDAFVDGKSLRRVAFFVYASDDITALLERFARCGKRIARLYGDAAVLARLVTRSGVPGNDPLLCIGGTARQKCLFLLENDRLCFVRHIPSVGPALDDRDVQNINMTVDYCFQTLRVKPRRLLCIGPASLLASGAEGLALPLQGEIACPGIEAAPEVVGEYAAPLGALLFPSSSRQGDLLPPAYRQESSVLTTLRRATWGLVLLCVGVAALVVAKGSSLVGMRAEIGRMRSGLGEMNRVMAEYGRVSGDYSTLAPLVAALNRAADRGDHLRPLRALAALPSPGVHPTSVMARPVEQGVSIQSKGELTGGSYGEMQAAFEGMLARVRAGGDLEIVSRTLDPVTRTFSIELLSRGGTHGSP